MSKTTTEMRENVRIFMYICISQARYQDILVRKNFYFYIKICFFLNVKSKNSFL